MIRNGTKNRTYELNCSSDGSYYTSANMQTFEFSEYWQCGCMLRTAGAAGASRISCAFITKRNLNKPSGTCHVNMSFLIDCLSAGGISWSNLVVIWSCLWLFPEYFWHNISLIFPAGVSAVPSRIRGTSLQILLLFGGFSITNCGRERYVKRAWDKYIRWKNIAVWRVANPAVVLCKKSRCVKSNREGRRAVWTWGGDTWWIFFPLTTSNDSKYNSTSVNLGMYISLGNRGNCNKCISAFV